MQKKPNLPYDESFNLAYYSVNAYFFNRETSLLVIIQNKKQMLFGRIPFYWLNNIIEACLQYIALLSFEAFVQTSIQVTIISVFNGIFH